MSNLWRDMSAFLQTSSRQSCRDSFIHPSQKTTMRKLTSAFLVLPLSAISHYVLADDCSNVIALSKTRSETISDKETVEQHADNFCKAYSTWKTRSRSDQNESDLGASFKFLKFSMSASNSYSDTSAEAVASKYCSATNESRSAKNAYRQYVETISPDGFQAYEACLRFKEEELTFGIDPNTVLPKELKLTAKFTGLSSSSTHADVTVNASESVACSWDGTKSDSRRIERGTTAILTCKRDRSSTRSFVSLTRTNGSRGAEAMSLSWIAYDDNGQPIEVLQSLLQELRRPPKYSVENLLTNSGQVNGSFPVVPRSDGALFCGLGQYEWGDGNRGPLMKCSVWWDGAWRYFTSDKVACTAVCVWR